MAESHEEDVHLLVDESGFAEGDAKSRRESGISKLKLQSSMTLLLTIGNGALFLASLLFYGLSSSKSECLSPHVKLETNVEGILDWSTDWSTGDEASVDHKWMNEIPWESGIIALTKAEAKDLGLPESQPFPWDQEEKGIYVVNAHHVLHCVRNLYIAFQEYRQGKPQSSTYPHILHCLDTIRRETMCTADDNLRWVPPNGLQGRPGDGQKRQCRDWPKLQNFVQSHDACYKYVCPGDETISNLHRFKYCPNDSQYLPAIREHFGYNESWMPWPYHDEHICGV